MRVNTSPPRAPHPPVRGSLPTMRTEFDRITMRSVIRSKARADARRWDGKSDPGAKHSLAEIKRVGVLIDQACSASSFHEIMAEMAAFDAKAFAEVESEFGALQDRRRTRKPMTPEQRERKQAADRARRGKQKEAA